MKILRVTLLPFVFWMGFCFPHLQAREELLFSDEFRGGSIDASDWLLERRPGSGSGPEKSELQYYLPEALTLSEGVLHIMARKIEFVDPHSLVHFAYTSGRLESKQSYLYGRFEFRARLPKGKGLWSFLGLRTPGKPPVTGEIAVAEGFGSHPNVVQSTLRSWLTGEEPRQSAAWLVVRPLPDSPRFHREGVERVDHLISLRQDLSEDFHVYAVDWQPDHVTWSFDGIPYFIVKEHIPKVPMVITLQLALGTSWDGKPDASTEFPQSLDIDYVRVWGGR